LYEDRTRKGKYDPKAHEKHPIYTTHPAPFHGLKHKQLQTIHDYTTETKKGKNKPLLIVCYEYH